MLPLIENSLAAIQLETGNEESWRFSLTGGTVTRRVTSYLGLECCHLASILHLPQPHSRQILGYFQANIVVVNLLLNALT